MGRPRKLGLEWLDPENAKQHLWARDYLRFRGYEHLVDANINPLSISRRDLLRVGQELENNEGARELFRDMKDAWRQEKNRNKKKEEGYRPCLFTLRGSTKDKLQRMAKELETDATELLGQLIEKAHKAHLKKQRQEKPKQTIYGDRQDAGLVMSGPTSTTKASKLTLQESKKAERPKSKKGVAPTPADPVENMSRGIRVHLQKKRTVTIHRAMQPAHVETDDHLKGFSQRSEAEMQDPPDLTAGEPLVGSLAHTPEQLSSTSAEPLDIWPGIAPTKEELRSSFEKSEEDRKLIAQTLQVQLKP